MRSVPSGPTGELDRQHDRVAGAAGGSSPQTVRPEPGFPSPRATFGHSWARCSSPTAQRPFLWLAAVRGGPPEVRTAPLPPLAGLARPRPIGATDDDPHHRPRSGLAPRGPDRDRGGADPRGRAAGLGPRRPPAGRPGQPAGPSGRAAGVVVAADTVPLGPTSPRPTSKPTPRPGPWTTSAPSSWPPAPRRRPSPPTWPRRRPRWPPSRPRSTPRQPACRPASRSSTPSTAAWWWVTARSTPTASRPSGDLDADLACGERGLHRHRRPGARAMTTWLTDDTTGPAEPTATRQTRPAVPARREPDHRSGATGSPSPCW